jgi:hypothetical protein
LGDAANGLDVDSAIRLTEVVRLSGDCANCVARKLCPLCPADFFEQGTSGRPDGFAFQAKCREIINALPRMLREYTTAMEANPGLIDQLLQREDNTHGWVDNVRFVLAEEQQNEIELGVEELEPMI